MNKEEIEKAKEDLSFVHEGDYITRSMSNSKDILEEYIKQLEKDKEEAYWKGYIQKQKEAEEICKMCKYRKRYKELTKKEEILNKVKDKLKEEIKEIKKIGSNGIISLGLQHKLALAQEILNIIEGEDKNEDTKDIKKE